MEKPSSSEQENFKTSTNAEELFAEDKAIETPSSVEKLIVEKLNPRGEIDQDGFGREIFTIHGKTICFRSREEMPIYPTAQSSSTEIIGSPPLLTDQSSSAQPDNESYQETKKGYETNKALLEATNSPEKPVHYSVDRSMKGVIELAVKLAPDNERLAQIATQVEAHVFGPEALTILDELAAVATINPDNGEQLEAFNSNAEIVVVLALIGDKEASRIVERAVEALHKIDAERTEEKLPTEADIEAIKKSGLMVVHSTRYEPASDPEGVLATETLFDATGTNPRASIHTSLNHKVEGHMYGDWSDAGYVIVSPLEDMVETNGFPTKLSGVDTWWSRNPGEELKWPNATLFVSGGDMKGQQGLSRVEGNKVLIKTAGYTPEDIRELVIKTIESGSPTRDLHGLLEYDLADALKYKDADAIDAAVEYILSEVTPTLLQGEDIYQHIPNYQGIESIKLGLIREAVQKAVLGDHLRLQGKQIFTGGMWESSGEDQVLALAEKLQLRTGPHGGTAEQLAEVIPKADNSINDYGPRGVISMNPKNRRVLMASGVRPIKYYTPNVSRIAQERRGPDSLDSLIF